MAGLILLCLERLANDQEVLCISNPRRRTHLTNYWWNSETDIWWICCSSVKSHLLCLQKVLHAGQRIHMLTSCTHPTWCWESQFLCVSSSLQSCALLFIPSCAVELLNICFLTLLLLSTYALAHNHKHRDRLKGHGLPRGWYSCSSRWYILSTGPLGACGESSLSIWW